MFRYLVTPEKPGDSNNNSPVMIAFSITNDTITGYFDTLNSDTYLSLSKYGHVAACIDYLNTTSSHEARLLKEKDPKHHLQHKPNDDFFSAFHFHFEYKEELTKKNTLLKHFLNELKACETFKNYLQEYGGGYHFITKKVMKDILTKFKQFDGKTDYITGNHPDFQKPNHKTVTLGQHLTCLSEQPSSFTCTLPAISDTSSLTTNNQAWNYGGIIAGTATLAAFGLGLFMRNRQPLPPAIIQEAEPSKRTKSKRTRN